MTDLVQVQPYPQHHFVRGVPISPSALKQASIADAAIIFVFANVRFLDPDLKTLHTVSRIRQLNPTAKLHVELADPKLDLAKYLGADVVIRPSRDPLESVLQKRGLDMSKYFTRG